MARRIKSNTKFSNVDILDFMKKVVEKHTRYYQSDFEIDKETLRRAAVRQEHQEKTLSGYAVPMVHGVCLKGMCF